MRDREQFRYARRRGGTAADYARPRPSGVVEKIGRLALVSTRMGRMSLPTSDQISAGAAAVGAVATLLGSALLYHQIGQSNVALFANNSYQVSKDLSDAFDHILTTEDEIILSKNADEKTGLVRRLTREALKLDALFEAADALQNNSGLSPESWKAMLGSYCPFGENNQYNFSQVVLDGLKTACERDAALWKARPR